MRGSQQPAVDVQGGARRFLSLPPAGLMDRAGGTDARTRPAPEMALDIRQADFWKLDQVDTELRRVYDICAGCRRCLPLCPSFKVMFDPSRHGRRGRRRGDAACRRRAVRSSTSAISASSATTSCPCTPQRRWQIDFPRRMLRARSATARQQGVALQDRFLGNTDLVGKHGSAAAPLSNWVTGLKINRHLMEATVGIHRDRDSGIPRQEPGRDCPRGLRERRARPPVSAEHPWLDGSERREPHRRPHERSARVSGGPSRRGPTQAGDGDGGAAPDPNPRRRLRARRRVVPAICRRRSRTCPKARSSSETC